MNGFIDSRIAWGLLLAAGIAFPWLAGNDYHLTVMSTAYIFAIATLGLAWALPVLGWSLPFIVLLDIGLTALRRHPLQQASRR